MTYKLILYCVTKEEFDKVRAELPEVEYSIASYEDLESIAALIEAEKYDEAEKLIEVSRDLVGDSPDLVRLGAMIDRIRILGE